MDRVQLVWSFDTDGVLNYYPDVWLEFLAIEMGSAFASIETAKKALGTKYDQFKRRYRLSDFKYQVPINPEARETICALKSRGDVVYISTSRPLAEYPHMRSRTMEWLKNGGIEFDGFLEKSIVTLQEKKCTIHVDDEQEAIQALSPYGVRCILYQRVPSAQYVALPNVTIVRDLRELVRMT